MLNILVVYYCPIHPLRATTMRHLYSFKQYSSHRCYYVNAAVWNIPKALRKIRIDLIVFDTLLMCSRWSRSTFRQTMERLAELRSWDCVRAALPQDEFISNDLLCEFINTLQVDIVFSVSPRDQWPLIYDRVNFNKVKFDEVLTGYIDEDLATRFRNVATDKNSRPIDIGYRVAGKPPPWFGRHGYLKQLIAEIFAARAPKRGLKIDISTENTSTLLGNSWFSFLGRCKYTIGTEGGTSILDRDGTISEKTSEYLRKRPNATFEEVEAACFPGEDGKARIYALSPRHLEACVTRTCQVLTEGQYSGVLVPGRHYIELKKDFSNIEEVLDVLVSDSQRNRILDCCSEEIVNTPKYRYKHFVQYVIDESVKLRSGRLEEPLRR